MLGGWGPLPGPFLRLPCAHLHRLRGYVWAGPTALPSLPSSVQASLSPRPTPATHFDLPLTCYSQNREGALALSPVEPIQQKLVFPARLQTLYGDFPLVFGCRHCLGLPSWVPILDHKGIKRALGHRP